MLDDPATQQFIRDQQQSVINQLYAPLIKQLALTPTEADQFRNLLTDKAMRGTDRARGAGTPAAVPSSPTNRRIGRLDI